MDERLRTLVVVYILLIDKVALTFKPMFSHRHKCGYS